MLDRDVILATIDDAYAKRARGDKAGVDAMMAPRAQYRMVGEGSLLPRVPVGPADGSEAIGELIDLVRFHHYERVDAVVEGRKAAVRWRLTLSTDGKAPVATELYDLWEFDDQGKMTSLLQFCDTALLAQMLSPT